MPVPVIESAGPKPDLRFMRAHPLRWIALGFGAGLAPVAPGTFGTLFGWLSFMLIDRWISDQGWAVLIALAWAVGIWSASHVIRALRIHDHQAIVWDEIAAIWTVMWVAAPMVDDVGTQFALFLLFRLFDVIKPPPIGWLDRHVKGGLGVMIDDAAAAVLTLFVFALWQQAMLV